ncbi:sarcosine oxidase subunit delta [Paraburkholderia sp. BCC1886]|uniref:sarcosine oxidase subunit delta n=1 Tax=Paraburkholderia sp. BCC1886 TaxID=2562670 RepID=UPI0011820A8A|nr:sarcosine oxidase subunit delta [Paraburkholderia sp. BCC1886]
MLRIPCPYCGSTRDEEEFTFGGPYQRVRPANVDQMSDEAWSTYLFRRENVRGPSLERWRHTFGCRQWFGIERDTVSHALLKVFRFTDVPRGGPSALKQEGGLHEPV